jgi:hypothetical protein
MKEEYKMENNLKKLSPQELLERAKQLVSQELKIALQLLEYLREIEARLIFAELGFDSMWSFCVNYLGLSEGDTQRKLAAMRLCKTIPHVKEDLTEGRISLTNAAKVQSFFNAERRAGNDLPLEKKKEILQSVHSLSKSECEKKLMELSPASAIPAERLRLVTQEHTELKVILDSETLKALDQLKDLLAHTLGDASYQALIQYMAEETLKRVKKAKGLKPGKEEGLRNGSPEKFTTSQKQQGVGLPSPPPVVIYPGRQAIPTKIRQMIFRRAKGKCEYQSPDGRKCESQAYLEINHKTPVAWGGSNDLCNLELTCRTHNGLHAQQVMGRDWMEKYR